MKKQRVTKLNSKKQKEAVKKFKLKKPVKAKSKKKVAKKKMITYSILTRKSRTGKWVETPDSVTASSKLIAVHIAAHRNPNRWVRVIA